MPTPALQNLFDYMISMYLSEKTKKHIYETTLMMVSTRKGNTNNTQHILTLHLHTNYHSKVIVYHLLLSKSETVVESNRITPGAVFQSS